MRSAVELPFFAASSARTCARPIEGGTDCPGARPAACTHHRRWTVSAGRIFIAILSREGVVDPCHPSDELTHALGDHGIRPLDLGDHVLRTPAEYGEIYDELVRGKD